MKIVELDGGGQMDMFREMLKQHAIDQVTDIVLGMVIVWLEESGHVGKFIEWAQANPSLYEFTCDGANHEHPPGDHSMFNSEFTEQLFRAFTHSFIDDDTSGRISDAYHDARGLERQEGDVVSVEGGDNSPVIDPGTFGMYL